MQSCKLSPKNAKKLLRTRELGTKEYFNGARSHLAKCSNTMSYELTYLHRSITLYATGVRVLCPSQAHGTSVVAK